MTDATHAGGDGRAEGGAGSDSATDAYEWRTKYRFADGTDSGWWPTHERHIDDMLADPRVVAIQRRRVGPWEDVD